MKIPFSKSTCPKKKISLQVLGLLGFFSAASSTSANADILFVDLNAALPEIQAAQRAADERGEKLWVLPEIPMSLREKLAAMDRKAHVLEKSMKALRTQIEKTKNADRQDKIREELIKISDQHHELKRNYEQLTQNHRVTFGHLKQSIQSIQDGGNTLQSIVFSGHSNGRDFSGTFGSLGESDVRALVAEDPRLQESVNGLYLWGCYTGTKAATLEWKGKLKNVDVVIGFHKQAPTDLTQASPALLESSLKKEAQFSRTDSIESAKTMLQSMEHASSFPIAGLINDCYVGTKIPSTKVSEEDLQCAVADQRVQKDYINVFILSYMGQVPNGEFDTQRTSDLRKFYNQYQASRHCPQTRTMDLSPQKIISLIHYKEVAANAAALYEKELIALREQIRRNPALNYQETANLLDKLLSGKANREDIFNLDYKLSTIYTDDKGKRLTLDSLSKVTSITGGPASPVYKTYLENDSFLTINRYHKHVYELECVPLSWVEAPIPGSIPEKPTCEVRGN